MKNFKNLNQNELFNIVQFLEFRENLMFGATNKENYKASCKIIL
jgi:hypothetical protein